MELSKNKKMKSPKKDNAKHFTFKRIFNPYFYTLFFFIAIILIGWGVLWHSDENHDAMKAIFTSVSATCVTGISVVSDINATYSLGGKIMMIILMFLGGLGFITILSFIINLPSYSLLRLFQKRKNEERYFYSGKIALKEAIGESSINNATDNLKHIFIYAFLVQFLFSVYFVCYFINQGYDVGNAFLKGIFHAVSSFNNAGFDLFGDGVGLTAFRNDMLFMIPTSFLIVFGGIGFVFFYRVFKAIKNFGIHFITKIDTNTKIVLWMTVTLLLVGAGVYYVIFKTSGLNYSFGDAFFFSVSSRTAGFYAIDFVKNPMPTGFYIWGTLLMFIGGAPCSAAGGIKVTTMFVALVTAFLKATGKAARTHHRSISKETITKTFSVIFIAAAVIFISSLTISICGYNTKGALMSGSNEVTVGKIIFLVTSAYCTVGFAPFDMSIINTTGLIVLMITMFFGRLGLWNILYTFNRHWASDKVAECNLPDANILIG